MTRHRFFVEPAALGGDRVVLTGSQAHQISRVLRLKPGDRVVLLVDGAGHESVVRLDEVHPSNVAGAVELTRPSRPEPLLYLTLYQALVPRDRFETVLQKGTEVGISRFVPTWCERSIVPGGERIDEKRLGRWQRIVTEAAEQCERGVVPEVAPPLRFVDVLAEALKTGPLLIAWEREAARSIRDGLREALSTTLPPAPATFVPSDGQPARRPLGLIVGPEGGFSSSEVEQARSAEAITVSLGPRILRTETAGPILAALALYEAGDLTPAPPLRVREGGQWGSKGEG